MAERLHSTAPLGEVHKLHNWEVLNDAAMQALSVTESDIGKVCRQTVSGDFFILRSMTPKTWSEMDTDTPPTFNPMDYGAVGDGVTDDIAAVQAAANAAVSAGGEVVITKQHKCNSQLALADGAVLTLYKNGFLDFYGAPQAAFPNLKCIVAAGSLTALPGLNANVSEGGVSITFASAHGLADGDIFFIENDAVGSFNPARNEYHDGESCQVRSVSGNTVTLTAALRSSYTTGTDRKMFKLNSVKVSVRGPGRIRGIGDNYVVSVVGISMGRHCEVNVREITGSQYGLVELDRCVDCYAQFGGYQMANSGQGLDYGLLILSSSRIRAHGLHVSTCRHAITCGASGGGAVDAAIPCRDIFVSDSFLGGSVFSALDCHGNTQGFHATNCVIYGGVSMAGRGNTMIDCEIWAGTQADGSCLALAEVRKLDFEFRGCTFHATRTVGDGAGSVPALVYWSREGTSAEDALLAGGHLKFIDCTIDMHGFGGDPMKLRQPFTQTDNDITIDGLRVRRPRDASIYSLVSILGHSSTTTQSFWRHVTIRDCELDGAGLSVSRCGAETVTVQGVVSKQASKDGILVFDPNMTLTWDKQTITVAGCNVERAQNTGIYIRGASSTESMVTIEPRCVSVRNGQSGTGGTDTRASYSILNVAVAILDGVVWGDDQAVQTQSRMAYFDTIGRLQRRGIVTVGGAFLTVTRSGVVSEDIGPANVRDYGAKGTDGDDTDAIFAAFSDVQGAAYSGHVHFPAGVYRMSSWPTITKHGMRITTEGARHQGTMPVKIRYTGSASVFITLTGIQGTQVSDMAVENIGSNASARAFDLLGVQRTCFRNVHALPETTGWGVRLRLDTRSDASCIYNTFHGCTFGGVFGAPAGTAIEEKETHQASDGKVTNNNSFYDVTIGNSAIGLDQQENPAESSFFNVEARGCTTAVVARGRGLKFVGGNIETCTTGISIPSGATSAVVYVDGVHFEGNTTDIANTAKRPVLGPKGNVDLGSVSGTVAAIDVSMNHKQSMTASGNVTIPNPANPYDGAVAVYTIQQDATGSRTITWGSEFKKTGFVASTAAFQIDSATFVYRDASSQWIMQSKELGVN